MRGALLALLPAAAGAGLASVIDYGPHNPWAHLATALVLIGIGTGGYHVMRGHAEVSAELRRVDREAAEHRAARRRSLKR